ncbi:iron permease [Epithele typhae]|uniref:iron permease n=1 Tax=Epithele typhae TaxID=378194 RepID=UPI00200860DC|nr:iron permease [Epithele typhae]KAH9933626.1 iron permease [Epithele typhae]
MSFITPVSCESYQALNSSADGPSPARGFNFWMTFLSGLLVEVLSALDLSAVSTTLPTIVSDLHGNDFIWAGSAYTIAATAVIPFIGHFASTFGRKPVLLAMILIFALGSALCGAAQSMPMFLAGRGEHLVFTLHTGLKPAHAAIQGFGGGGSMSAVQIINADMIPLPERGKFQGIAAVMWAVACSAGPIIGGGLARGGNWRWLFYINLPLCGISFTLSTAFLRVRNPTTTLAEKIKEMDLIGLTLVVGSTVSFLIGMTWGGVQFSWSSAQVLAPLTIGAVGIVLFFVIEALWIPRPTAPSFLYTSRTTLSGYLGTFFHGIVVIALIYYTPIYLQATQGASALTSGIDMLPIVALIPIAAMFTAVTVQVTKRYLPLNIIGWVLALVGFGVLSILTETSPRAAYVGLQTPAAIATGILWICTTFPVLAPLPYSNSAHALAFFSFTRQFAQSWGITIAGTILQNGLQRALPPAYVASLPEGASLAYAAIPTVAALDEPLRTEVRVAFARATQTVWRVMVAVAGAGLLSVVLMREVPMKKSLDERWGLRERDEGGRGGGEGGEKRVSYFDLATSPGAESPVGGSGVIQVKEDRVASLV